MYGLGNLFNDIRGETSACAQRECYREFGGKGSLKDFLLVVARSLMAGIEQVQYGEKTYEIIQRF